MSNQSVLRTGVKMIERVSKLSAVAVASADFSFTVFEKALLPFNEEGLGKIKTIPAYEKIYVRDDDLYVEPNDTCRMIATASVKGEVVGYVAVSRSWNGCAQIDEIMISRPHRGAGIGRALMDEAVLWAKQNNLSIMRLETQDTNVAACRFYERYGSSWAALIVTCTMPLTQISAPKLLYSGIFLSADSGRLRCLAA